MRTAGERTQRYRVERIGTEEALARIVPDWKRLHSDAKFPNPFMSFEWFDAWQECAKEALPGRLHLLAVFDGDAMVGLVPLVSRTATRAGFAVQKLEFGTNYADYRDFVIGRDIAGLVQAIAGYLQQTADEWDVIELRELRETPAEIATFCRALEGAGLCSEVSSEAAGCPYMAIEGGSSAVLNRCSGRFRRNLLGRIRRAEADGLRARIVVHPEREPGLLERLIELERKKSSRTGISPFVERFAGVFQRLSETMGPSGQIYIALLEKDNFPVAFQLGFRAGDMMWDYTKAHDEAFGSYAPGSILIAALLDHGAAQGIREFDFLRGEEPYKRDWTQETHVRSRMLIWNRRWLSRMRKYVYCDVKRAVYGKL